MRNKTTISKRLQSLHLLNDYLATRPIEQGGYRRAKTTVMYRQTLDKTASARREIGYKQPKIKQIVMLFV